MRTACRIGAIAVGIVLAAQLAARADGLDLRSKIDPLARPLVEDQVVVGLVLGIVKEGKTQVFAYGETELGSGSAPTGETIYEIGSISKALTGSLLAHLVQAGEVKLDDPVQRFLPDSTRVPALDGQPITLEHLATHTSGLPRLPSNLLPRDHGDPYAEYGDELLAAFLNGHKLRRAPGRYEYSNLGAGLLGSVLARQQGKTYERLLVDLLAGPLGMKDTRISLDPEHAKRLAPGYTAARKPAKNWNFTALAAAGGVRSSVRDMLVYLEANLAKDDAPSSQALRLAHRKRHAMEDGLAMGLGWHIARDGVTRWHNGMTGGYASWAAIVPELGVGVVVLSNTATDAVTVVGEQVTRVACGGEVKLPAARRVVEIDRAVLESYAGTYAITPDFVLTVTLENGRLMVGATGQEKFPIFAESKTKFFYRVVDAQITFVPDEDGKVNRLILHQNGRDVPAVRQR